MKNYYLSEKLKVAHTFFWPLCWAAPVFLAVFAFFLAADYFQINLFNWWYGIILHGVLALSCCLMANPDKKQHYRGVLGIPVDLKKVWYAKVLVLLVQMCCSFLVLFLMTLLGGLLNYGESFQRISWTAALAACLLLPLVHAWQIPLWLWLGNRTGVFLTMVAAVGINTFGQFVCSLKDWWFLMPFSYGSRMMCPVLGILPNGLLAKEGSMTFMPALMTTAGWLPALLLSLVLLLLGSWAGARWLSRREVL